MFKKLKDKIAEEVKSSPQRIQQIAQAAQAVVSSASSTTSEISGSENFFSITEEETPHNSPLRKNVVSKSTFGSKTNLNNGGATLTRRLSNSSMASDTSFRLPSYDNPAIYHLQSDLETSAGEESTVAATKNIQLESITKEQVYHAYRKILDRYQKYRGRYTELAQRYRDLESDNNKARAVLVETQEKALRRLCELREQCSLEQQAKAHLEAALRLEMDELQCVNKTLKSKLDLLGETSENLVDLEDTNTTNTNIQNNIIEENDNKITQLKKQLIEADEKVKEFQTREEENTILLAENKMMIHSELERKETEVKELQNLLASSENNLKQSSIEKEKLQETISQMKVKLNEVENKYSNLSVEKIEVEKKIHEFDSDKSHTNDNIKFLQEQINDLNENKTKVEKLYCNVITENDSNLKKIISYEEKINELNETAKKINSDLILKNELIQLLETEKMTLNENIKSMDDDKLKYDEKINELKQLNETFNKSDNQEIIKMREQLQGVYEEREINCNELIQMKDKLENVNNQFKKLTDEKNTLQLQNDLLSNNEKSNKEEITILKEKTITLSDELKYAHIRNENSESEAIKLLESTMKTNMLEMEEKFKLTITKLTEEIQVKTDELKQLTENNVKLSEKLSIINKEYELNQKDIIILREKKESLKNDKKDLEKTLEREIREKGELKIQVTNILQEIGRLEDQLKEVKNSHSILQNEKTNLEMKIESLQSQTVDEFERIKKDENEKCQIKINLIETELIEIQKQNTILTDKNVLLEENILSLQNVCKTNENGHHEHLTKSKENIKKLNEKLQQCLNENTELLNAKELLEHEYRSLQDDFDLKDKEKLCLLDTYKKLEVEIYNLKAEKILLNDRIKEIQNELSALTNQNFNLDIQNKAIETENNNLQIQFNLLKDEMKIISDEKKKLHKTNEKIQKDYNLLSERIIELEQEKITFTEQSNDINIMNKQQENRINELETLLQKTNDEKKTLKESIEKNATDLDKKIGNYEELKIENQYLNTLVKQLEGEQKKINEDITELTKQNDNLNLGLDESTNKIEELSNIIKLEEEKLVLSDNELKIEVEKNLKQISEMDVLLKNYEKQSLDNQELKNQNDDLRNNLSEINKSYEEKIDKLNQQTSELIEKQNNQEIQQTAETKETRHMLESSPEDITNSEHLLKEKNDLELKLQKIMNEVQDVSIRNLFLEQKCENYLILEQSNERLKLTNDKLLRQLDETLVSMQHHEGISANTEFEYLKNIMFQYLSGNINKNNSTLVKVIAAVLKFSPQQTQTIIEKEHQRNSLLGQLNLL